MTRPIRMPLSSLNLEKIKDLQEKYPDAEISVEVSADKKRRPMSDERFWKIIAMLDWSKTGDDDAILFEAKKYLSECSVKQIFGFADLLSQKLFELDRKVFAENIGEDGYSPDQYFSVDNFLYARACVVANGKELYKKVLKSPSEMPKDITFEAIIYLPSEAYEMKTGKKINYIPTQSIETYSNTEGW